jgi:hypothetical protein
MLRRALIVLSAFAVLGFTVASPAGAEERGRNVHGNKNVNVHRNVNVNRNVNVRRNVTTNKFVVGRRYNGHVWYGHNRHRWHGRWYAYGVGPCWIDVDGEFFWNIAVCP